MVVTYTIPRDRRAPAAGRTAVDLLDGAVAENLRERTRLLVSEVVTNSVRHGAGDRVLIFFDLPESGSVLRCEVVDRGHGFIPRTRDRPATEPGGWGLQLVDAISDAWGVRTGSTHVWFELSAASVSAP